MVFEVVCPFQETFLAQNISFSGMDHLVQRGHEEAEHEGQVEPEVETPHRLPYHPEGGERHGGRTEGFPQLKAELNCNLGSPQSRIVEIMRYRCSEQPSDKFETDESNDDLCSSRKNYVLW